MMYIPTHKNPYVMEQERKNRGSREGSKSLPRHVLLSKVLHLCNLLYIEMGQLLLR